MNETTPNIAGIILAAGTSSRFGKTKQLLPFRGGSMLTSVIETATSSRLKKIYLVLGHDADEIRQTLNYPGLSVIYNPDYEKGQSTSIRRGLEEIDPSMDGVIFLMGDQPLVKTGTINKLIQVYSEKSSPIVLPVFKERQGSPVLFGRSLFPRLKKLTGDSGGRQLFEEFSEQITRVPVADPGIHFDVDTRPDYLKLKETEQ